ncbi:tyrosine-type recombinase/integrase [Geoglobus sp.]
MGKQFHDDEGLLLGQLRLAEKELPERSFKLILGFKKKLLAEGVGKLRISRYIGILRKIYQLHPVELGEWSKDDIIEILALIEEKGYKRGTINEFRKTLKRFIKYAYGEKSELLDYVSQIRKRERRIPEIINEDDVLKVIDVLDHPRDKAMIAVCYEAGLRIGELASLRIRDIQWLSNSKGELIAKIKVRGKTGERVIPIIMATSYLKRWLDEHPYSDNINAFVFCALANNNYGGMISYRNIYKIFVEAGKKAGLRVKLHPHILRHSRATILAKYLTEAQMCQFFGWVQGSDMPRIYVHLSGRDVDSSIMKIYGFETEEEKEEVKARPKKCPRCGYINAPTDIYCGRCALILDEGERARLEMEEPRIVRDLIDYIAHDPEKFERLKEMIEFIEKLRENPELTQMLLQLRAK